jgi:hypothetical protein
MYVIIGDMAYEMTKLGVHEAMAEVFSKFDEPR